MQSKNTYKPAGWEQHVHTGFIFKPAAVWPCPCLYGDIQDQVQRQINHMWSSSLPLFPVPWCRPDTTTKGSPSTCCKVRVQAYSTAARQKKQEKRKSVLFYSRTIYLTTVQALLIPPSQPWDFDSICCLNLTPLTAAPSHRWGFSQTNQKLRM